MLCIAIRAYIKEFFHRTDEKRLSNREYSNKHKQQPEFVTTSILVSATV